MISSGSSLLLGRLAFRNPVSEVITAWFASRPAENDYDRRDERFVVDRVLFRRGDEVSFFEEASRSSFALVKRRCELARFFAERAESGIVGVFYDEVPMWTTFSVDGGQLTEGTVERKKWPGGPKKEPDAQRHYEATLAAQQGLLASMTAEQRFEEHLVRDAPYVLAVFLVGGTPLLIEHAAKSISTRMATTPRFIPDVAGLEVAAQTDLLHALREGDERLVIGLPRDLAELRALVDEGKFREDLYYRLDALALNLELARPA